MPRTRTRISDVSHTPAPSSPGVGERPSDAAPPFFNTTFSLHRVSPLFVGPHQLDAARLKVLAQRLRDTLVGDVVRGIQIGLEATSVPTGQVGVLRSVAIRWFQADAVLGENGDAIETEKQGKGLWIDIRHENAAYSALLLPSTTSPAPKTGGGWSMQPGQPTTNAPIDDSRFLQLPLLLMRMPMALKQVVGDWIASTFDCRVSKLTLGTKTIVNAWESWIREHGVPLKGPDVTIRLAFNAPLADLAEQESTSKEDGGADDEAAAPAPSGLRSMDITLSPQDLRRFVRLGNSLPQEPPAATAAWDKDPRLRRRLAGGNADNGWAWRSDRRATNEEPEQPFTEALARYLDHHLALNLFHPSVQVVQVSCGGFVLAASRVKIVRVGETSAALSNAAWRFVGHLGERVRGDQVPAIFST